MFTHILSIAAALAAVAGPARADTPAEMMARYGTSAGSAPTALRGQRFFTSKHGHDWSCSSCHGEVPVQPGRHAVTGKVIGTMAPALNAERFTDPGKTEKWFRRNCNDVVGRECTAGEKADLLAWLLSLKA